MITLMRPHLGAAQPASDFPTHPLGQPAIAKISRGNHQIGLKTQAELFGSGGPTFGGVIGKTSGTDGFVGRRSGITVCLVGGLGIHDDLLTTRQAHDKVGAEAYKKFALDSLKEIKKRKEELREIEFENLN